MLIGKFCHSLQTAIANAVTAGFVEGLARGLGLVIDVTFEQPAIEGPPPKLAVKKARK